MKRSSGRVRAASIQVHRLKENAAVVLAQADTVILVVRGACAVRGSGQKLLAGSLLLRQAAGAPVDRRVTRALALLQAEPSKPWTVERLARATGLSRAAFARRFALVTGQPPARYLAELRLALAAALLQNGDDSLAEVAERVGYASEFAFSRAFKRRHGVAPGVFRRVLRTAPHTLSPLLAAA